MKKFMAVCGQGLGSSLIIEMNIKDVLEDMGIDDIGVEHTNLNSFDDSDSDILAAIVGADLSDSLEYDNKIVLKNLLDKDELEEKISNFLKK